MPSQPDCPRSAITRRVESGEWHRIVRGVPGGHARPISAGTGPAGGALDRRWRCAGRCAAAWWLGLCSDEPRRHLVYTAVSVVIRVEPRRPSYERRLLDEDVIVHRGLCVTERSLTVLDASETLGIGVIDSALLRRTVTIRSLEAAHARYPKRHGSPAVCRYLAALANGARSEAERMAVGIFTSAGLTGWIANYPTCWLHGRFAFPEHLLAVEIDGFAFHRDADAFQRDRTRRNALIAAGWEVLNFTWSDLTRPASSPWWNACSGAGPPSGVISLVFCPETGETPGGSGDQASRSSAAATNGFSSGLGTSPSGNHRRSSDSSLHTTSQHAVGRRSPRRRSGHRGGAS